MGSEAPDYADIAARAKRGEYERSPHSWRPQPLPFQPRNFCPFGEDFERYLEKQGVIIPIDATSIMLRYEPQDSEYAMGRPLLLRVTIKRRRGKKQRHYIPAPVIDNGEAMDT